MGWDVAGVQGMRMHTYISVGELKDTSLGDLFIDEGSY
jgi:hypothetical protein